MATGVYRQRGRKLRREIARSAILSLNPVNVLAGRQLCAQKPAQAQLVFLPLIRPRFIPGEGRVAVDRTRGGDAATSKADLVRLIRQRSHADVT